MEGLCNANDVFGSDKILNEDIYVNYLFYATPPIQRHQIQQLAEETKWPMIKRVINKFYDNVTARVSTTVDKMKNDELSLRNMELEGDLALICLKKRMNIQIEPLSTRQCHIYLKYYTKLRTDYYERWKATEYDNIGNSKLRIISPIFEYNSKRDNQKVDILMKRYLRDILLFISNDITQAIINENVLINQDLRNIFSYYNIATTELRIMHETKPFDHRLLNGFYDNAYYTKYKDNSNDSTNTKREKLSARRYYANIVKI